MDPEPNRPTTISWPDTNTNKFETPNIGDTGHKPDVDDREDIHYPRFHDSNPLADPNDGTLEQPLIDPLATQDTQKIKRIILNKRCCPCCGSRYCWIYPTAVLILCVGLGIFMYYVLLPFFVGSVLAHTQINVTKLTVGAPVSDSAVPIEAILETDVDLPDFNYSVLFSNTELGFYLPGDDPSEVDPINIGNVLDTNKTQLVINSNSSTTTLIVKGFLQVKNQTAFGLFGQVLIAQPNITCLPEA